MDSKISPNVEETVSTLMSVDDEEVWKAMGLFD
jgi:hypothetical protein